jgi:hypothetical protein
MPRLLTAVGGSLIIVSGLVSTVIGLTSGAVLYEPDPNDLLGHVGIVSGLAAIAIGAFLIWFGHLERTMTGQGIRAGLLIVIVGHLGGVTGALLIGTAGMLCCYVAGIWLLVQAIKGRNHRK